MQEEVKVEQLIDVYHSHLDLHPSVPTMLADGTLNKSFQDVSGILGCFYHPMLVKQL